MNENINSMRRISKRAMKLMKLDKRNQVEFLYPYSKMKDTRTRCFICIFDAYSEVIQWIQVAYRFYIYDVIYWLRLEGSTI